MTWIFNQAIRIIYHIEDIVPVTAIGSALAVAISWSQFYSVPWAILHGILGWLYVPYYVVVVE